MTQTAALTGTDKQIAYAETIRSLTVAQSDDMDAKFAAAGKPQMKKNLGMISMTYKNIYVAQVSLGDGDFHVQRYGDLSTAEH